MRAAAQTSPRPFLGLNVEQRYRWLYKPAAFLAGLVPLGWIACNLFGWQGYNPVVDGVKFLERELGQTALNFLMLTLMVTPIRLATGLTHLLRLRRMLGLFTFFYAAMHFTVYVVLDLDLDWRMVGADILKRPYITVGFAALMLMIPLAVTSTNGMRRRLGRRWATLHRVVYVIAILGVWHFYWQEKVDVREPLMYVGVLAALLGFRLVRKIHTVRQARPAAGEMTSRPS